MEIEEFKRIGSTGVDAGILPPDILVAAMDREEWVETLEMLCFQCDRHLSCDLVERMLEFRCGEIDWFPEKAWRYCEGSGVTCDSYVAKIKPRKFPMDQPVAESMCAGCACREGSLANRSLHTQRDLEACVDFEMPFSCHERVGVSCAGWAQRVSEKEKDSHQGTKTQSKTIL
jgi:hypothetical protein